MVSGKFTAIPSISFFSNFQSIWMDFFLCLFAWTSSSLILLEPLGQKGKILALPSDICLSYYSPVLLAGNRHLHFHSTNWFQDFQPRVESFFPFVLGEWQERGIRRICRSVRINRKCWNNRWNRCPSRPAPNYWWWWHLLDTWLITFVCTLRVERL